MADGRFGLFTINPDDGARQMTYCFRFHDPADGQAYFLRGFKALRGRSRDYADRGHDHAFSPPSIKARTNPRRSGPRGIMTFDLRNILDLLASIRVLGAGNILKATGAKIAFLWFLFDQTRCEYLSEIDPFYRTAYKKPGAVRRAGRAGWGKAAYFPCLRRARQGFSLGGRRGVFRCADAPGKRGNGISAVLPVGSRHRGAGSGCAPAGGTATGGRCSRSPRAMPPPFPECASRTGR